MDRAAAKIVFEIVFNKDDSPKRTTNNEHMFETGLYHC